jgi:hypothetical protein
LAQWERSMTWCDGVTMSAGGDATLGGKKGGDDVSWPKANLIGPKNEEKSYNPFNWYK